MATTIEKVYKLEVQGTESLNELKSAIEQLNDKLKTLNETSKEYKETLEELTKLQDQLADAMKGISDSAQKTEDSISGISEKIGEMGETISNVSESLDRLGEVDGGAIDAFVDGFVDGINEAINSVDGIEEKLDRIDNVDVSVNIEVNDASIDSVKDHLENIEDVEVKVDVVAEDSSIDKLKEDLDNIEDAEVKVNVEVTDDSIDGLKDRLDTLEDTTVNVDVNTSSDGIEKVKEEINELEDKTVSVNVEVNDDSVENLTYTLDGLEDTNVNVSVNVSDESLNGVSEDITNITENLGSLNDEAEKTSETLNNIGNASTVKELKQEISDLRDRLVTLDKGTDEYRDTVKQLIDDQVKLKEVMNAGKNETQAAEGSYNALSQRMSALKQVWKEATDEATRDEIGNQIAEINTQLKGMDASIGNFQRNVGNYKSALDGLDGSFVNLKTQLRECKEAMQQLDPASQAYTDAMTRAAEITHQLSEQQEQIKYASTDFGDQLENVRGIATNLAAGYSAVNAAMGLFGSESEEVKEAMLKVQQAMALVQGMQGLDGFIKRTKGLSQSMGLATKATQANTVATKANATAAKADAVAMGAEAAATKAAVPAQLSLNAAMKANPIGFIIGLIASLIAIFSLLKDKIMEMIGSNKEMSAAFDKVKAVLAGFGNIIKKSVINPVKLAIIPIKTLAKVIIDMFKGDWSKIGDDFKAGMEEMKDVTLDTINVVGAFKEGYDKKTAEQNEAARKAEAAAREKELDNIIKDNEAKYGSDWKYTEEAKKLYDELLKVRMAQYKEDSDEYREAQRDKLAYDREFNEKAQEQADKAAADAKKKQEQAAKEAKQLRDKLLSDFKSAFEKYTPDWDSFKDEINKLYNIWTSKLKNGTTAIGEFKKYLMKEFKLTEEEAQTRINSIYENFQKAIYNDMMGKRFNAEMERDFYNMDRTTKNFVDRENNYFNQIKVMSGVTFPDDEIRHFDEVYRKTADNIEKESDELESYIDKMYDNAMSSIDILGNLKVDDAGIQEWIDYLVENYNVYVKALQEGNVEVKEQYEQLMKDIVNDPWNRPLLEESLGEYLSEFQKMLDKREELSAKATQKETEHFQKIAEIRSKVYEKDIKELQKAYDSAATLSNLNEQKMSAEAELLSEKWGFVTDAFVNNSVQQFNRGEQEINEYYDGLVKHYNDLIVLYEEMANNEELTAEERAEAHKKAEDYKTEVTKANINRRIELEKNEENAIKKWKQQFKDLVSTTAEALGNIADYYQGVMDLEKMKIDKDLEAKKIDEKLAAERYAAMEEEYKKVQGFQAAQTIINGLSAAISAYQSLASIPYVGPFLGAAAAAAAIAASVVNAKKIMSTEMDKPYGGGGGSSSSTNFQLPDVLELEPTMGRNLTNQSDIDELNNSGGRGRGEPIECYVVESQITAKQELANRRKNETTF